MKDRTFQGILVWGMASVLIFTPIARGAVGVWTLVTVLGIVSTLVFLGLWRTLDADVQETGPQGKSLLDRPVFFLSCLVVVSFMSSIYKYGSFLAMVTYFSYVGVYYLLLDHFNTRMFGRSLGLVTMLGAGLSLYGLLQYMDVFGHSWWYPGQFLAGSFVNHNHFAGYLELVIPLTFGAFLAASEKRYRFLLVIALAVMVTAFVLAQSRGAWGCLGIALFVMSLVLVKKGRLSRTSVGLGLVALSTVIALICLADGNVSKRIKTLGPIVSTDQNRETSFQTRLLIWQGTLGMIRERPIRGIGIGNFDAGFDRFRPEGLNARAVYAHNDYLQLAAEMGCLAPLIVLWMLWLLFRMGFSLTADPVGIGCAAGMLSLSLHGLFDFNFHIVSNSLLFVVFAAYLVKSFAKRDPGSGAG